MDWAARIARDQAIKSSDRSPELLVKNLDAIPYYQEQHRKVFGTDFNPEGVAKAIAAYERTILSGNSPYRFDAGDKKALSAAAQRGLALFKGKAGCVTCHVSFNFTDENYHNVGVGMDKANPDLGRYRVSKTDEHKGAIKLRPCAMLPDGHRIYTTVPSQRWKKWWRFTIRRHPESVAFERNTPARSV